MTAKPPVSERIARPGDADLDCWLAELTVTAVIAEDATREILVRLTGGHGFWINTDGELSVFDPDDPDSRVTDVDMRAWLPDMPDEPWRDYVAILERWRDNAAPVMMCSAPGRCTMLIGPDGEALPWPRREIPVAN